MRVLACLVIAWAAPSVVCSGPPDVGICTLVKRDPTYRGRVVRVAGFLRIDYQGLQLVGDCAEPQEGLCLEMGAPELNSPAEEPVAIAEVSEDDFVRSRNLTETWDAMPWTPLKYEPLAVKEDERWRRLRDLKGPIQDLSATLVGRFEYVNTPSTIRFRNGKGIFIRGYGPGGNCYSRLVVAEVRSIEQE